MQYVKFGNTGMDVSRICLGMMSFGKPGKKNGVFPWARDYEDAKPLFKKAIDLGINYFDTANVYQMGSSEEITGRLVRDFGLDRDEIVVATKVHFDMRPGRPNGGGSSRKNILAEIDHSLKRLDMDYVDLYQIHRLDANTPMEEIMEALHDVVKSGKARYIGASTIFAWQLERMQQIAETNFVHPFLSAICCMRSSCHAKMVDAPMYRALPLLTTSCSASMISSIGVFASRRWIW